MVAIKDRPFKFKQKAQTQKEALLNVFCVTSVTVERQPLKHG